MTNLKSRAALAALALIAAGLLSACGGNPIKNAVDDAVGNAVENGVEGAIENAAGDDVDINVNVDGSAVDLPSSFPSGIPLADGGTLVSTLATDEGWNLTYSAKNGDPADGLVAKFKADSSWEMTTESVSTGFSSWMFSNAAYSVVLLSYGEGEEYGLTLTVTPVTP